MHPSMYVQPGMAGFQTLKARAQPPAYAGWGTPPALPPGWDQGPAGQMAAATIQGMREVAGAVIQDIRQLFGIRLDRNEEFSWLTTDVVPTVVAAGAVGVRGIMTVGQEADFVATAIVAQVETQAVPPVLNQGNILFVVRDGSTGRDLVRNPIPITFLGLSSAAASPAGSRPFFLPKPRIFSRNSQVIFVFDSDDGVILDVRIAFVGYKIYDVDALDLTKAR